jgi:hypothetical protein
MTIEDLDNKFGALSSELLSEEKQKEIKNMIFNCDDLTAKDFMSKLVV